MIDTLLPDDSLNVPEWNIQVLRVLDSLIDNSFGLQDLGTCKYEAERPGRASRQDAL